MTRNRDKQRRNIARGIGRVFLYVSRHPAIYLYAVFEISYCNIRCTLRPGVSRDLYQNTYPYTFIRKYYINIIYLSADKKKQRENTK